MRKEEYMRDKMRQEEMLEKMLRREEKNILKMYVRDKSRKEGTSKGDSSFHGWWS